MNINNNVLLGNFFIVEINFLIFNDYAKDSS